MREELGDTLFLEVLRAYLEDRKYRVAKAEDLLRIAEKVSGQEVDDLYKRWILDNP